MRAILQTLLALSLYLGVEGVLAGSAPLDRLAQSHYPQRWLWEPVGRLQPESVQAELGEVDAQGHALTLERGGAALFRLPRNYWLRLSAEPEHDAAARPAERPANVPSPDLWISDGNGLFVPAEVRAGASAGEWLLPPSENSAALLSLENKAGHTQHWRISRAIPGRRPQLDSYRDTNAAGDVELSWFFLNRKGEHLQLSNLQAGEEYRVTLRGPGEFRLEVRTLEAGYVQWQRFLDLPLQLNGKHWRDWRLHPRVNHRDTLETQQCELLGSAGESLYISLPEGEHSISFVAPQAMAVRVLAQAQDNFLFEKNQPLPGAAELLARYRGVEAPAARVSYNEAYFASLLDQPYPLPLLPHYAAQLQPDLAPSVEAAQLVEQRYRFWRPLPAQGVEQAAGQVELIDVALREPRRGQRRYLTPAPLAGQSGEPLLRLGPAAQAELDGPDGRALTMLKLSLPVSAQPYDLFITNRQGKETVWRWRPGLISTGELDLVRERDLARLLPGATGSDVAIASARFTVARDEFPLRIRHNASHAIWFSPFYRDNVQTVLAAAAWSRAREELGTQQMLALLLSDSAPAVTGPASLRQQLRAEVWEDWQPLRQWLRSYQALWSDGLVKTAGGEQVADEQYSKLLQDSTDSTAHITRQLSKGAVVHGTSELQREQALVWLGRHYSDQDDRANLSAYRSWRFQHAPRQQLQALADWLLMSGLEAMAVRLYQLADTAETHLPYQQARLDSGWHTAGSGGEPLISAWDAIWRQDWSEALHYAPDLAVEQPWREFLLQMPQDSDPVSWLQWAQLAPATQIDGLPARKSRRLIPRETAATLQFDVTTRGLQMQRALARPDAPVRYSVVGPVELQLSLSLYHSDPLEVLNDWVEIASNGDKRHFPMIDSVSNPRIRQLPRPEDGYIGMQQRVTLALGPGRHELTIRPLSRSALVDARLLSPLLLSNLLYDLQQNAPIVPAGSLTVTEMVNNLAISTLENCGEQTPPGAGSSVLHSLQAADAQRPIALASQWSMPGGLGATPVSLFENPRSAEAAEQYLLQLLWQWPAMNERQRESGIARANDSARAYVDSPIAAKVLRKLNEGYTWQLEESVIASAGSRRVSVSDSSEHPVVIARERLLFSGAPPPGERLDGYTHIGFLTRFEQATRLRIRLKQVSLPHQQTPPASVTVTLNETLVQRIELPPFQRTVSFTVPAGPQRMRLRLEQPSSDHWVYVQVEASLSGQWRELERSREKRYQVATQDQMVEYYLPGPRWLRVDEYRDGRVVHRYQLQDQAGALQLGLSSQGSRSMYRVFSWQPKHRESMLKPYPFAGEQQPESDKDPAQLDGAAPPVNSEILAHSVPVVQWLPDERTAGSASSTDGLYLEYESRLDLDTDASGDADERFFEAGWRHRRALDCQGCYWRSDVFFRKHDDDDIDVAGTQQWLRGDWVQSSWRWALKQSLWYQAEPKTDWAWHGSAAAVNTHDINEKLAHEYQFEVFGRYLSADDPDYPVDNDIYTRYKEQHKYGAKMAAGLRGRPWLDSLWTARASLSTNEDFNPLQPDFVQAGIAWRQYWRPLALSASYRHRLYLSDDDRDSTLHRPALALAVNSLTALRPGQLLNWDARLDYDLDRGEYGFVLSVSLNHARDRGLQDFYPGRSSFHNLRSRDLSETSDPHQMKSGEAHGH